MKKLIFTLVLAFSFSGFSLSNFNQSLNNFEFDFNDFESMTELNHDEHGKMMPKACKEINLSMEQKHEIFKTMIELKKEMIDHTASMKKLKIDYVVSALHTNTDIESANNIGMKLLDHSSKMKMGKFQFIHNILYKTLDADQRKNAVICMIKLKKMKGHKRSSGKCNKCSTHK